MSLSDEEIDRIDRMAIWHTDPTELALPRPEMEAVLVQAREANRLRAALAEALDGWEEYAEDTHRRNEHDEWPKLQMDRIAALRKLLDGAG